MSSAAGSQQFLKTLRSHTEAAHQALEAHPYSRSITDPDISAKDYIRYLQIMQRVVDGYDAHLHRALAEFIPDMDDREKHVWIKADLQSLEADANPFPLFRLPAPTCVMPAALGAWYVLEGSTLGGRVILKSLPPFVKDSTRYFEGYGAQTGPMWQGFLNILTAAAAKTDTAANDIIQGAEDAFAAILQYFNTCVAHEASGYRQS